MEAPDLPARTASTASALRVPLARWALDKRAHKGCQALLVQREPRVHKGYKVSSVFRVRKASKEMQDHKGCKGHKDPKEFKDSWAYQVPKDRKDWQDYRAAQEHKDLKEFKDCRAIPVLKVSKGSSDYREAQELKECRGPPVQLEPKVFRA